MQRFSYRRIGMQTEEMQGRKNYRWYDEFAGNEAYSREQAIGDERKRGEGIDDGVDVGEPLKQFESSGPESVPKRTVSTQEDFDRT